MADSHRPASGDVLRDVEVRQPEAKSAVATGRIVERCFGRKRKRARKGPFPTGPASGYGNTSSLVASAWREQTPGRGISVELQWLAAATAMPGQPGLARPRTNARENGSVADERADRCRELPEPEGSPRWSKRLLRGREFTSVKSWSGADRETSTCYPVPRDRKGRSSDRAGRSKRGEGSKNPRGVCGRNTSPGARRSKPSRSWETAKVERSGVETRDEVSSDRRAKARRNSGTGKWTSRAGSAVGERNLKGEWTYGRNGSRRPGQRCGRKRGRDPREREKGHERCPTGRETDRKAARWNTPGSRPQGRKDVGGAAKPDEWRHRAVIR